MVDLSFQLIVSLLKGGIRGELNPKSLARAQTQVTSELLRCNSPLAMSHTSRQFFVPKNTLKAGGHLKLVCRRPSERMVANHHTNQVCFLLLRPEMVPKLPAYVYYSILKDKFPALLIVSLTPFPALIFASLATALGTHPPPDRGTTSDPITM